MEGLPTKAAEPEKNSLRGLSSQSNRLMKNPKILIRRQGKMSEAQSLIPLVHSRTIEDSPSLFLRLKGSTSGSPKRLKHGDESDNFHAAVVSSRVLEEEIDSATRFPKTPIPATMENLPDELLLNIFVRLLAKQLAQMRSVSKSWNALLSQSSFIRSHLDRSIHNNDQVLLVFHASFPLTEKPSRYPRCKFTNSIKLPVNPRPESTNVITVIGSVNGLICSSYGDSVIHIWNPSLSAVLTLPPYSIPPHGHTDISIHLGFGFEPKRNDYKLVKLTGLNRPHTNSVKCWLQVEIYSMRKGTWELITERFPSHITFIFDGDNVCIDGHNGHLHWLGLIGETMDSKMIVAFDLGTETFREMPLPDSTLDHNRWNILAVFAEKLCVMSVVGIHGPVEVWVMEEYGVAESWVKHHVFSHYSGSTCVLGFTSRNEFVIKDGRSLVLYDPIDYEQKDFENYCPKRYCVGKIVEYVDSLVWVAPAEHEMLDGGGQN